MNYPERLNYQAFRGFFFVANKKYIYLSLLFIFIFRVTFSR